MSHSADTERLKALHRRIADADLIADVLWRLSFLLPSLGVSLLVLLAFWLVRRYGPGMGRSTWRQTLLATAGPGRVAKPPKLWGGYTHGYVYSTLSIQTQ